MKNTLLIALCVMFLTHFTYSQKLSYSEPIYINDGYHPYMLKGDDGKLHLVYAHQDKVLYQTGNLEGKFDTPQKIFDVDTSEFYIDYKRERPISNIIGEPIKKNSLAWQPRIIFDKNNNLHLALASGPGKNVYTWYTNNIGGKWNERTYVFNRFHDALNTTTCPSIAIDNDLNVYIGVYTYGISRSALAKLVPKDGKYVRVLAEPEPRLERSELFIHNNELYVAGHAGHKDDFCIIQKLNKNTFKPAGEEYRIHVGKYNEASAAAIDNYGMIHLAGASITIVDKEEDKVLRGWYTNSELIKKGEHLSYATECAHHWGAAMPIRDLVDTTLVYLLYPNTNFTKREEFKNGIYSGPCVPDLFYRMAIIKNNKIIAENLPISDEEVTHGSTFRYVPCMVPHPEGGMVIVFSECPEFRFRMRKLYFTRVKWE